MLRGMTRLLLIACLCMLTSCHVLGRLLTRKPKKKDKPEVTEVTIGAIELVNPDQHFVLIRTGAHLMLNTGTMLYSTNAAGQVTKLKVTPEHKGSYLAADIVSGSPKREDPVVFKPTSDAPPALTGAPPVKADVTTLPLPPAPPPLPSPAPPATQPPVGAIPLQPTEPAPSEFLRPVPGTPLPSQQ